MHYVNYNYIWYGLWFFMWIMITFDTDDTPTSLEEVANMADESSVASDNAGS